MREGSGFFFSFSYQAWRRRNMFYTRMASGLLLSLLSNKLLTPSVMKQYQGRLSDEMNT